MTLNGHIEDGNLILDAPIGLANGTKVRIEVISADDATSADVSKNEESFPTLYEMLKPVIGLIKDAPPDLARNHDHYIHGTPKK